MDACGYEITTRRLRLRALSLAELRRLIEGDRVAAGARIGARVPTEWPGRNLAANLPGIAADMARLPGDERWVWVVIDPAAATVIGDIGFHSPVTGHAEVEMGYVLLPAYRGCGYATEASAALLEWAFECAGVERVVLSIKPGNTASLRVAEKLGMRATAQVEPGYLRFERVRPRDSERAE